MSSSFQRSPKRSELKTEPIKSKESRIISLSEVSLHDSFEDCWVVIFNEVYNLTPFMMSHPGGAEVLLENAGRDATLSFQDAGHSNVSLDMMENYKLGTLPEHERLDLILKPIYSLFKLKT